MLEYFKNRALLLKVETTEGTDAVPVPGTDAFQLLEGSSGIDSDKIERMLDRPFFTNDPYVPTKLRGYVEGKFEVVPPAGPHISTSKASVDVLLKIAGMAKTFVAGAPPIVRYNPISAAIPSATAYFYHAGTLYAIVGARANISSLMMDIGSYIQGQCRIEGGCQEVQEVALPTNLDYSAFTAPIANTTETMEMRVNGIAVEGKSIGLNFNNTQQTIEHTEARLNRIKERKATTMLRFYRPARATLDPWALWKAGTIIPAYGTVTDPVSGLQTKISTRMQIEDVKPVDIDGDLGYDLTGRCIASDAGGDEFLIEFTDTTP
jgi:hypothetical protein